MPVTRISIGRRPWLRAVRFEPQWRSFCFLGSVGSGCSYPHLEDGGTDLAGTGDLVTDERPGDRLGRSVIEQDSHVSQVPLNTQAPLTLPGMLSTAGHWDQSRIAIFVLLLLAYRKREMPAMPWAPASRQDWAVAGVIPPRA